MKRVITAAFIVIVTAFVLGIVVLLIGSLRTEFMPVPTEFENTVWVSEDGLYTLYVNEYTDETMQCRTELVSGSKTYDVLSEPHGVLGIFDGGRIADEWLRTSCNGSSFTVKTGRVDSTDFSQGSITFIRQ